MFFFRFISVFVFLSRRSHCVNFTTSVKTTPVFLPGPRHGLKRTRSQWSIHWRWAVILTPVWYGGKKASFFCFSFSTISFWLRAPGNYLWLQEWPCSPSLCSTLDSIRNWINPLAYFLVILCICRLFGEGCWHRQSDSLKGVKVHGWLDWYVKVAEDS